MSFSKLSMSEIQDYFGESDPISLSEYYRGNITSGWPTITLEDTVNNFDSGPTEEFGRAISISGDTIVIGGRLQDPLTGIQGGRIYVYTKQSEDLSTIPTSETISLSDFSFLNDQVTEALTLQQILAVPGSSLAFSKSVDIDGDRLVAGDHSYDDRTGRVVVFRRDPESLDRPWTNFAKNIIDFSDSLGNTITTTSPTQTGVSFGTGVAISNDTIIVSAPFYNTTPGATGQQEPADGLNGIGFQGLVQVLVSQPGSNTWTRQANLTAADDSAVDQFGRGGDFFQRSLGNNVDYGQNALDISGDTVVIGAAAKDVNSTRSSGQVYIFTRSGSTWSEDFILRNPFGQGFRDEFGYSVAVDSDQDLIAIGCPGEDIGFGNSGAVFVYRRSLNSWSIQDILTFRPDVIAPVQLGYTVDIGDNKTIIAGAPALFENGGRPGKVYIFETSDGFNWSFAKEISHPTPADGDLFGIAIGTDGKFVIIGAPSDSDEVSDQGSVFILNAPYSI